MKVKVRGAENLTLDAIRFEVERGGRFVVFQYCISIVVMSFKRPSPVYFIREGESAFAKGIPYTLLSLVCGWWGIPWGPIWTIGAVIANSRGGRDITQEVVKALPKAA